MPAGPGSDHEDIVVTCWTALVEVLRGASRGDTPRRRSAFWVQTSVAAGIEPRDADVAADALADLVETTFLDLLRQERVGDRRPGRADNVEWPDRIAATIVSGFVKRPTPTIGFWSTGAHGGRIAWKFSP